MMIGVNKFFKHTLLLLEIEFVYYLSKMVQNYLFYHGTNSQLILDPTNLV